MLNKGIELRFASWNGPLRVFYLGLAIVAALLALVHASHPERMLDEAVADAARSESSEVPVLVAAIAPEQRAVAEFIAKRYRVAEKPATGFVLAAFSTGRKLALDPLLLLAVMAVESRYNPVAQSEFGARGLMQVIPKFHVDKLKPYGGEGALLDPEVNIHVGGMILREYLRKFGEIETALQMYAGAFDEPTSQYANKVLAERSRLEQVLQRTRREFKAHTAVLRSAAAAEPG